jgi:dimeric dUTPase (all-alpha-NTP-PPase superfamily)
MTKLEKVTYLLNLQDALNTDINQFWKKAGYNWSIAALAECGEFINHCQGWKWWKQAENDYPQGCLELVDIFHFLISPVLAKLGTEKAAEYILGEFEYAKEFEDGCLTVDFKLLCSAIAEEKNAILEFAVLCRTFGLDFDRLFSYFTGKHTLNLFRQMNGYGTGSYIKMWDGVEDNVYLSQVIESGAKTPDEILDKLESKYRIIYASANSSTKVTQHAS